MRDTRPTVPAHVDATLTKALQKLPADRFDTAADFLAALEGRVAVDRMGVGAATGLGPHVVTGSVTRPPWLWPAVAGGALVVGLGAGWLARAPQPAPPPPVVRMYVEGDSTYSVTNQCCGPSVAISPDGARLAFMARTAGGRAFYRRDLDDVDGHAVPGTNGGYTPFFDPTGRWLGFVRDARLMKTDLSGGTPLSVADLGVSRIWGATWGDDGFIYYTREDSATGIRRVSAQGGTPELVSAPDTSVEENRVSPAALPGGRGLLYVSWPKQGGDSEAWVAVLDLEDGSSHRLTPGIQPYYSAGHIIYALADGTVMARAFDLASLSVTGEAVRVGEGVITHNASDTEYAVSRSGTLVTRHGGSTGGGTVGTGGSTPLLRSYTIEGAATGVEYATLPGGRRRTHRTADGSSSSRRGTAPSVPPTFGWWTWTRAWTRGSPPRATSPFPPSGAPTAGTCAGSSTRTPPVASWQDVS